MAFLLTELFWEDFSGRSFISVHGSDHTAEAGRGHRSQLLAATAGFASTGPYWWCEQEIFLILSVPRDLDPSSPPDVWFSHCWEAEDIGESSHVTSELYEAWCTVHVNRKWWTSSSSLISSCSSIDWHRQEALCRSAHQHRPVEHTLLPVPDLETSNVCSVKLLR